jgi:hypothetical protein
MFRAQVLCDQAWSFATAADEDGKKAFVKQFMDQGLAVAAHCATLRRLPAAEADNPALMPAGSAVVKTGADFLALGSTTLDRQVRKLPPRLQLCFSSSRLAAAFPQRVMLCCAFAQIDGWQPKLAASLETYRVWFEKWQVLVRDCSCC